MKTIALALLLLACAALLARFEPSPPRLTLAGVYPGMSASGARSALLTQGCDELDMSGMEWTARLRGCSVSSFRLRADISSKDGRVAVLESVGAGLPLRFDGASLWTMAEHRVALGEPSEVRREEGAQVLVYDHLGLEVTLADADHPWRVRWNRH